MPALPRLARAALLAACLLGTAPAGASLLGRVWDDIALRSHPANLAITVAPRAAGADLAVLARALEVRVRAAGGYVASSRAEAGQVTLELYLPAGPPGLTAILRPRVLGISRVLDEAATKRLRERAATGPLPAGVTLETGNGDILEPSSEDREALLRFLKEVPVSEGSWALSTQHRYESEQPDLFRAYLLAPAELGAADVAEAAAVEDPRYGHWEVAATLTADAGERFASLTRETVGKRLAIALDDEVESAPVVKEAITGGRIRISMGALRDRNGEEATAIAAALSAGALPCPVELVSTTAIGLR